MREYAGYIALCGVFAVIAVGLVVVEVMDCDHPTQTTDERGVTTTVWEGCDEAVAACEADCRALLAEERPVLDRMFATGCPHMETTVNSDCSLEIQFPGNCTVIDPDGQLVYTAAAKPMILSRPCEGVGP